MGKHERKIEVIKKYIDNAAGSWPAYTYNNIPSKVAINACSAYAGAIQPNQILGLIDITVMGNGKKGMIFTDSKIYYDSGMLGSRGSLSYKKIHDSRTIDGDVLATAYNTQALKEMISMLAQIEGEDFQSVTKDLKDTLGDVQQGAEDVKEILNQGKELVNTFKGLFK